MNYSVQCVESGKAQGEYRFSLVHPGKRMLFVIGLNPSTADESHPDRTMLKVMKFAENGGYDGFAMFNLSAERSTNKYRMSETLNESRHRENLSAITKTAELYPDADILVAFGNGIMVRPYLKRCFKEIYEVLKDNGGRWKRIGALTVKGNPRHPLYASFSLGLNDFDVVGYIAKLHL